VKGSLRSSFARADYLDAVSRVREYIYAGDIFQANLSQRFEAPLALPPWDFYRTLRRVNPAPFGAFFDVPGAPVLSTSPERFLRVSAGGHVETRPIKGTRARGVGPEHDAALGQALTESAKDRAENLMIVDLMRNDLSRVARVGARVRSCSRSSATPPCTTWSRPSSATWRRHDAFDLLRAAFPGGSITGAPKLRAMEIIAELEPSRRGVLRVGRLLEHDRRDGHEHCHPHGGRPQRTHILQCRRRHRGRLDPEQEYAKRSTRSAR
jgi:para-aminobenzoate synthetase component 1